jgi:TRAP transporter TAXI family solute receptor
MMRKRFFICCVLLIITIFFAALTANAQPPVKSLAIATGGTGGGYYPMGGAIAALITEKIAGLRATAEVTAASVENIRLLERDRAQLALINAVISYNYDANKKLSPAKYKGISSMMVAGYADVLPVVLKNSPVKKMADLKGKRIGIGAPGSGTEIINKLTLSGWGLFDLKTGKMQFEPAFLSFSECTTALKDRRIDAAMYYITGRPGPAITDLALTHDIRFIGMEENVIEKLVKKFPFILRTVYPKGLYKGVDYDTVLVQSIDMLTCRTALQEDLVYVITKVIAEGLPNLKKTSYHGFVDWELSGVVGKVFPLHPGVKKYYDEMKIK